MTILIDLTSVYRRLSGIERFSINISKQMIAHHPETRFVLLFREEIHLEFAELCRKGCAEAVVLGQCNLFWFYQMRRLWALLRREADCYLFPAFPAPWLFFKKNSINIIHDLCDFDCTIGKSTLKVLYSRIAIRHAISISRKLVTVSEFSKERLVSRLHVAPGRIVVVYNSNTSCLPEIYADSVRYIDPYGEGCDLEELLSRPVSSPEPILRKHTWKNAAYQMYRLLCEIQQEDLPVP
ncbi:MAG: glycosyltransferase [Faecousia sp.]